MFLSIIFFLAVTIGFSFCIDLLLDYKADVVEQFFMRIGFGTCALTIYGVIIDFFGLPLHFLIFLMTGLLITALAVVKKRRAGQAWLQPIQGKNRFVIYAAVIIMGCITAYMYIAGSFNYSYFENDDPWDYTVVSKVISESQTIQASFKYNHYSEPYTQGYQIFMGVLNQTNHSMYWTMKFFTNLVYALSIPFFFFFALRLFRNKNDSLFTAFAATCILFSIPSWLSHFVFSNHFNMSLFFVFLYAISLLQNDTKWKYCVGIVFASILVNHFFTAITISGTLALIFLSALVMQKNFSRDILFSGCLGFLLALFFYVPAYIRHPQFLELQKADLGGQEAIIPQVFSFFSQHPGILILSGLIFIALCFLALSKKIAIPQRLNPFRLLRVRLLFFPLFWALLLLFSFLRKTPIIDAPGTASRIYTFMDFFQASAQNLINNPIGWGPVITLLVFVGSGFMIWRYKHLVQSEAFDALLLFNLFILFFFFVHGMRHSIIFMPFRHWTFLAPFVSLLAAIGLYELIKYSEKIPLLPQVLGLIFLSLILSTSFVPKYELNAAQKWPDHHIVFQDAYSVYEFIRKNLPEDSSVIRLGNNSDLLFAYDMFPPVVSNNYDFSERTQLSTHVFNEEFYTRTLEADYALLREHEVQYVVLGKSCALGRRKNEIMLFPKQFDTIRRKVKLMLQWSQKFKLLTRSKNEFLFQVL